MKLCNKCEIIQDDDCFYLIKNGTKLHSLCKLCCSIKNKENNKNRDKSKKQLYNILKIKLKYLYKIENKKIIINENIIN